MIDQKRIRNLLRMQNPQDPLAAAIAMLQAVWDSLPGDHEANVTAAANRGFNAKGVLRHLFDPSKEQLLEMENMILQEKLAALEKQGEQSCPSCHQGHDCRLRAGHPGACQY